MSASAGTCQQSGVVALYCRLSPRPDGSYEGVEHQEEWGRTYAARRWPGVPIEVFPEPGLSAAKQDVYRPEYERLREWVRDGRVRHIWCVEQKRIERKVAGKANWFELAAELDTAGIEELHTDRDGVVRVQDEVAGIKAVLAAAEVRILTRRVRDTLAEKARRGEPGGRVSWGYERAFLDDGTKTLVIVEDQAALIREAATRVLAGWSLRSCAADLAKRGVKLPYGGAMVGDAVRRVLVAPTTAGKRAHGEKLYEGNWPAILDEETWQLLQAQLGRARKVSGRGRRQVGGRRRNAARRYLLTGGLARCGVCGNEMIGAMKTRKAEQRTPYLLCRPASNADATYTGKGGAKCVAIPAEAAEKRVVEWLFAELEKPEFLSRVSTDNGAERRAELTTALTALEERRRKLAGRYALDEISDGDWDTMQAALGEREHELRVELAAVPVAPPTIDIDAIRELWPTEDMTLDERRAFIRRYVAEVTIRPGRSGVRRFDPERVGIEPRFAA